MVTAENLGWDSKPGQEAIHFRQQRGGLIGQVRQLASTILHQPARVMIGNRDELKANQDGVVEICC